MQRTIKIAFIGAGGVNFGTSEGPWDHASRLEKYSKVNQCKIEVSGVVDPDASRVDRVLAIRRNGSAPELYTNTKSYRSVKEFLSCGDLPDAVFIGLPPDQHGTMESPKDIEVQCAKAGISLFIEKPISCSPIDDVSEVCEQISQAKKESGLVVSVAYMLRYSAAVNKMKGIIRELNRPVVGVHGRYCCTYPSIAKLMWWDVRQCGGPIVEQATHFCDLARYFGGDVDFSTVVSTEVSANEPAGDLSALPIDESLIAPEHRIARMTSAMWRFNSGAIGTLSHSIIMHGTDYVAEMEVWGDGYRLVLIDPYHNPVLRVRLPGSDKEKEITFGDDDLYFNEVSAFLGDLESSKKHSKEESEARILSPYADALESYKLSVTIRDRASMRRQA